MKNLLEYLGITDDKNRIVTRTLTDRIAFVVIMCFCVAGIFAALIGHRWFRAGAFFILGVQFCTIRMVEYCFSSRQVFRVDMAPKFNLSFGTAPGGQVAVGPADDSGEASIVQGSEPAPDFRRKRPTCGGKTTIGNDTVKF